MDDGAVRAGAGNRVEAQVAQLAGFLAQRLQPVGHLDLAQGAGTGLAIEPCQEAADGGAVATMGGADALQFDRVFAGLGQRDRISVADQGRPAPCRRVAAQ